MKDQLNEYLNWLSKENQENPRGLRPESPEHFEFKTLWIPVFSGNRTATFDLNHEIGGWATKESVFYIDKVPMLVGFNGNCQTPYAILSIPKWLTETDLEIIAERIAVACNKPKNYPAYRVLKADSRMITIVCELEKFIKEKTIDML